MEIVMFINVKIPIHYTILSNPTDSEVREYSVLGLMDNDFTYMGMKSNQTPWTQYDKTNKFLFKASEYLTSYVVFQAHSKIRSKSIPPQFDIMEMNVPQMDYNFNSRNQGVVDDVKTYLGALNAAAKDINEFLSKYSQVRLKGPSEFLTWVNQQDDLFGFRHSNSLSSSVIWNNNNGHNYEVDVKNLKNGVNRVAVQSDESGVWSGIPEEHRVKAMSFEFEQRMMGDVPYDLKTVKFNPRQNYPLSMKYRYESEIGDDATNILHPDASAYGLSARNNYRPPLLDWLDIGYPKISQLKSKSSIRRKPMMINLKNFMFGVCTEEGQEEIEQQFEDVLPSLEEMFSTTSHLQQGDFLKGAIVPHLQKISLNVPKISVLSDYSRIYTQPKKERREEPEEEPFVYTQPKKERREEPSEEEREPTVLDNLHKMGYLQEGESIETYGYEFFGHGYVMNIHTDLDMYSTNKKFQHSAQTVNATYCNPSSTGRTTQYLIRKRGTGGVQPFVHWTKYVPSGVGGSSYEQESRLDELLSDGKIAALGLTSKLCVQNVVALKFQPLGPAVFQTNPEKWMNMYGIKSEALKMIFKIDSLKNSLPQMTADVGQTELSMLSSFINHLAEVMYEIEAGRLVGKVTIKDIMIGNMLALEMTTLTTKGYERTVGDETEDIIDHTGRIIVVPHTDLVGCSILEFGDTITSIFQNGRYLTTDIEETGLLGHTNFGITYPNYAQDPNRHMNDDGGGRISAIIKKINYKNEKIALKNLDDYLQTTPYTKYHYLVSHERCGFTVSDPFALPLEYRKGKVIPTRTMTYTAPFPTYFAAETTSKTLNKKGFGIKIDTDDAGKFTISSDKLSVCSEITYNPKIEGKTITESKLIDYDSEKLGIKSSDTEITYDEMNPPYFQFKMMKTTARHLKQQRLTYGYTRGKTPNDFIIFSDIILPWQPLIVIKDTSLQEDLRVVLQKGNATPLRLERFGSSMCYGTANYSPSRHRYSSIPEHFREWMDGIPCELCPETYSFFGRTLGILNWWGSIS